MTCRSPGRGPILKAGGSLRPSPGPPHHHDLYGLTPQQFGATLSLVEPNPQARNEALARAAEIARRGRASAAAQGVSEIEVDAAIDEAIQYVRRQKRNG